MKLRMVAPTLPLRHDLAMPVSRQFFLRAVSAVSLIFMLCGMSAVAVAQKAVPAFGKVPLSFEPNRGQTADQVQFLSRGPGYTVYLAPGEAMLQLQRGKATEADASAALLKMGLVGADPKAAVVGQDVLPGIANYFEGSDPKRWKTSIPTYKRVNYHAVYPGIDLVYYGNQRELEYDFVVSPGANPNAIGLAFKGATPKLDASGDLVLAVAGGETRFHKPLVYQMAGDRKHAVEGRYEVADGKVGFALGSYDHSRPLIIDPVLSYLTYLGGSTNDLINGIAVDNAGSAYVVGTTNSVNFPVVNAYTGTIPGGTNGNSSMFVTKFNSTGTALVYSTYLGGTGNTQGNGIALDSAGDAYVVGHVDTAGYPITPGAFQTFCGGANYLPPGANAGTRTNGCLGAGQGDDGGVVTKLNPSGTALVYSTYLGGNNYNSANAVAVDAAGEAYVVGVTNSQCAFGNYGQNGLGYQPYDCFPTTAGAVQAGVTVSTGGGTRNFAFFSKLDAAGANLLYSTLLGPNNFGQQSTTAPLAVAVDPAGLAYIAGYSSNNLYTTSGTYQPAAGAANSQYGFVAKFDPTAQHIVYSTYLSGPHGSQPYVAADAAGNAYLAGNTNDCSYPTTSGSYQPQAQYPAGTTTNCNAGFVSKLDPSGTTLLFSTFLGGAANTNNSAALDAIALGPDGSIYVAGIGSGGSYPLLNPVVPQNQYAGYAIVTRLNPTGSALLFSTTLSGTTASNDRPTGIAVDPAGNIYVAGFTSSTTLPTTPGAFIPTNNKLGNSNEGFVAKIAPTVSTTTILTLPGSVNAGQPATFTAKVAGPSGTTTIPTGTVTFLNGSTTLGSGTLDATGTATYTATSLNATTYNVTASYSGDPSFSSSTSAAQSLVVAPAVATVTLTAPTTAAPGASVTLAVKVAGSNGTPTGSVTFKDGSTTLSTVALASGAASYTSTAFSIGSHSLTAVYTGDSIYGGATSSAQTLVVGLIAPTVTLTALATAVLAGPVTLSASVAGSPGTPSGSVTFQDGSTVLSTVTVVSGTASYTTSMLAAGTHTITAVYSGDATFGAATSAPSTVTVSVAPAITFSASPSSLTVSRGSSVTSVITGTPVGGYTGTVTFACGTLPAGATCTFVPPSLTFTGNNAAASTTLTFGTTTTSALLQQLPGARTLGGVFAALLLMPFVFVRKRGSAHSRLLLWLVLVGGSASMVMLGGCGKSSKSPTTITTAPGVYVVPVIVTAGTAASTVNLSITVQ